jgi:hypothetical protein
LARKPSSSRPESRRRSARGFAALRHGTLIAAEAVLIVGLLKDWVTGAVRASDLPGYGKVLFVMGATLGLLGGLFLTLERVLARGVAGTHATFRALPLRLPSLAVHALILGLLYLVYARQLGFAPF